MNWYAGAVVLGTALNKVVLSKSSDDVINFFTSTISDGADVRSIRADHP